MAYIKAKKTFVKEYNDFFVIAREISAKANITLHNFNPRPEGRGNPISD